MNGLLFSSLQATASEETVDENTADITLTLLPQQSITADDNNTTNGGGNYPKTNEQIDYVLGITGCIMIIMCIVALYILLTKRRERDEE